MQRTLLYALVCALIPVAASARTTDEVQLERVTSQRAGSLTVAFDGPIQAGFFDRHFRTKCQSHDTIRAKVFAPAFGNLSVTTNDEELPCAFDYIHAEVAFSKTGSTPAGIVIPISITFEVSRGSERYERLEQLFVVYENGALTSISYTEMLDRMTSRPVTTATRSTADVHKNLEPGDVPGEAVLAPWEQAGRCVKQKCSREFGHQGVQR